MKTNDLPGVEDLSACSNDVQQERILQELEKALADLKLAMRDGKRLVCANILFAIEGEKKDDRPMVSCGGGDVILLATLLNSEVKRYTLLGLFNHLSSELA